jgi:hypothetical protein
VIPHSDTRPVASGLLRILDTGFEATTIMEWHSK